MASCNICARETCDVPVTSDPNVKYSQGDVYSLKESVYTPIYHILGSTFAALAGKSATLKRNQQSLYDLTRTPDVIRSGRPAVIMEDDDGDNPLGPMVCVATTYSGQDISKLPLIFRHFSIPVASNGQITSGHHIHALPEWDRENAYIIAWQFRSTATREFIWTAQADGEPEEVPQVLGKDAMEFLHTECERRRDEWKEMCRDPKVAAKLEAELRKHVEDRREKKRADGGASTTSLDSMAIGIDSPSWRRTVPGTSTIPKDSEDDVVPGTPGNPQKPEPWKIVMKHRPESVHSVSSTSSKKKGANWDKFSKSNRSRSSFSQKPHKVNGICNFDLLLAVKGR
uniref:Mitogen-activated protein kinase kinase kinase n=1 Tax=Ganoderma boninense TaxID=34458 RepID=A0A5K1K692_9APHY|nr:Mitogen-activated protein kinase kinase kinase [Ganoderma boninense]